MAQNSWCFTGNIVRDAEVRTTNSGTSIANLTVAINNRRKNQQTGEWEDDPAFVDCKLIGARAEKLGGYLTKGTKVSVQATTTMDKWQDRETGQNRSKLVALINELDFMSRNQDGGYNTASPNYQAMQQARQQASRQPQQQSMGAYADADLPF